MKHKDIKALALALHLGPEAFCGVLTSMVKPCRQVTLGPRVVEDLLIELGVASAGLLVDYSSAATTASAKSGHTRVVLMPLRGGPQGGGTVGEYSKPARKQLRERLGKPAPPELVKALAWLCRHNHDQVASIQAARRWMDREPSPRAAVLGQVLRLSGGNQAPPCYDLSRPMVERMGVRSALAFTRAYGQLGLGGRWEATPILVGEPRWTATSHREWHGGRHGSYREFSLYQARINANWVLLEKNRPGGMVAQQAKGKNPWLLLGKTADGVWVGIRRSVGIEFGRLAFDAKGRASLA